jgi:ABC-2 type transport system ATP-binding protein
MQNLPALQIQHVTKKIGRKTIIDDITFAVSKGEVFGLLGPNGAGKTTLIRMIVGLMSLTAGDILIQGASIQRHFKRAIGKIGAIVENPELYKFLSGYENLAHFARMVSEVNDERIKEVISLVRLEGRIHDPVKTYSLGMRQRLGVAQAILHKPSVLILDEPTNGLDPAGIRELRDYLRLLAQQEGTAVIVSSHLLSEMELMCDRFAILQHGKMMDVKWMNEINKESAEAPARVRFMVDNQKMAQHILGKFEGVDFQLLQEGFEVQLKREQIADLNEQLVLAGVRVYFIRPIEQTLEDKFLEMTGGGSIA